MVLGSARFSFQAVEVEEAACGEVGWAGAGGGGSLALQRLWLSCGISSVCPASVCLSVLFAGASGVNDPEWRSPCPAGRWRRGSSRVNDRSSQSHPRPLDSPSTAEVIQELVGQESERETGGSVEVGAWRARARNKHEDQRGRRRLVGALMWNVIKCEVVLIRFGREGSCGREGASGATVSEVSFDLRARSLVSAPSREASSLAGLRLASCVGPVNTAVKDTACSGRALCDSERMLVAGGSVHMDTWRDVPAGWRCPSQLTRAGSGQAEPAPRRDGELLPSPRSASAHPTD